MGSRRGHVGERPAGIVEPVSEPSYQALRDLHAYWLGKKGDRVAPPRSAIKPEEMVALLPNIALLDVVGEPPRYFIRLFGTGLVAAYGGDISGKFLDEVDLDAVGPDLARQLTKLVLECRPDVCRIRFSKCDDGRYIQYERIALPLSEDGKTVDKILLGYVPEKSF